MTQCLRNHLETMVGFDCCAAGDDEVRIGGGQDSLVHHAAASNAPYGVQPAATAGGAFEAAAECGGAFGGRQTAPGVSVILHEELALGALIGEGGFGKARPVLRAAGLSRGLQDQHGCARDQAVLLAQVLPLDNYPIYTGSHHLPPLGDSASIRTL